MEGCNESSKEWKGVASKFTMESYDIIANQPVVIDNVS